MRSGNFQTTQSEPLRATVSIGVAYITQLGSQDSIENLLRDADVALYQAKAGGRDRVVLSPVR